MQRREKAAEQTSLLHRDPGTEFQLRAGPVGGKMEAPFCPVLNETFVLNVGVAAHLHCQPGA